MIQQIEIQLPEYPRGIHLITGIIEKKLPALPDKGLMHILIKHTSAAITINENADPSVRSDLKSYLDKYVPENEPYFRHTFEGSDDMPAHIKASLFGVDLTIPITSNRLNLGTWQGIYLCEFRNHGGRRNLIVTIVS